MADGESRESQTEEPTEKLGDAVERGDVPFAREAPLFASVAAMLLIGAFSANSAIAAMTALLSQLIDDAGGISINNGNDAVALMRLVGGAAATIMLAPLATLACAESCRPPYKSAAARDRSNSTRLETHFIS